MQLKKKNQKTTFAWVKTWRASRRHSKEGVSVGRRPANQSLRKKNLKETGVG